MYNTVCWTSFFHNIKVIVLVKKMKAPLLLQIDETYNQAIAAMECVFLRYIDKCKFAVIERDYLAVIIVGD